MAINHQFETGPQNQTTKTIEAYIGWHRATSVPNAPGRDSVAKEFLADGPGEWSSDLCVSDVRQPGP